MQDNLILKIKWLYFSIKEQYKYINSRFNRISNNQIYIRLIDEEIKRIKLDMNVKDNGYPAFWNNIRKDFKRGRINYKLDCPMNRLVSIKIAKFRSPDSTLSMDYFFRSFPLEEDRRHCRKVEDLIHKYQLGFVEGVQDNEEYLLLRHDFDELIADIRQVYLSKNYLGLVSWLIDRAFLISPYAKNCATRVLHQSSSKTSINKALLLQVLYKVSPKAVIKIFSGNLSEAHDAQVV